MHPLLAIICLTLALGCSPEPGATVSRTVEALGTQVRIEVEATDREAALLASEALLRGLEEAEERLSTWRESSELSAVNRWSGEGAVPLSPELRSELAQAFALSNATGGAFDPTVGPLVRAWSLRTNPREPSPAALAEALSASSAGFAWDEAAQTLTRGHAQAALEEGAWGKGAAIDAAFAAIRKEIEIQAFVDLGGQYGYLRTEGEISVADPRSRDLPPIATIQFGGDPSGGGTDLSGSFATTGNSERGGETGHILDPRTGRPAFNFGSVTVWAQEGLRADALSTALFVLGPDAALDFAESEEDVEALVVVFTDPDHPENSALLLRATSGFRERLRSHDPHPPPAFTGPR